MATPCSCCMSMSLIKCKLRLQLARKRKESSCLAPAVNSHQIALIQPPRQCRQRHKVRGQCLSLKNTSIKLASFSCLSTSPWCQTFKLVISDCAVTKGEQVPCGQSGISSSDCEKMGCCVDSSTYSCYYPLDGKASVYGDDIKIYFNLCSNRRPLYFLQLYWFNFLPFSFQSALEISTLFLPFAPTLQPSLWTPPKLLFLAMQTVNQSLLMTRLPSSNSKLQNVELVLMWVVL